MRPPVDTSVIHFVFAGPSEPAIDSDISGAGTSGGRR
jgi:hypothetical protein